jgi:hypothetical protein
VQRRQKLREQPVVNRFWAILVTAFASQVVVPAMAADVQIVFGESLAPFAD